jgi:hypothetical protein
VPATTQPNPPPASANNAPKTAAVNAALAIASHGGITT